MLTYQDFLRGLPLLILHAPLPDEVYIPGVNMRRFLPYTALALYLSVLPATAADRYGGWLLEQPRSSVFTLSFKQSVPRNGKIATSELGFNPSTTRRFHEALVKRFGGAGEGLLRFLLGEAGNGSSNQYQRNQ